MLHHFGASSAPVVGFRAPRAPSVARAAAVLALAIAPGLSLAGSGIVSGRVTERATATALEGIRVEVWSQTSPFSADLIGSATTGGDGRYAWIGRCPWICYLSIHDERYLYASLRFYDVNPVVTADFALVRPATIGGRIRVDGAVPADHVEMRVEYYSPEQGRWLSPIGLTHEQDKGRYVIGRVPPDVAYRICAGGLDDGTLEQCFDHHDRTSLGQAPAYELVGVEDDERREDIDFDLVSGGRIGGTLHDGYLGAPLANTRITLAYFDEAGSALDWSSGFSDANGRYRFGGLPDGSYYVAARIDGPFSDAHQVYPGLVCGDDACPPVTEGQRLRIEGGSSVASIDFTVHPDFVVRGHVTDAATGQGLGGVPIYGSHSFRPLATSAAGTGEYVLYTSERSWAFNVYTRGAQPYIDQLYPAIPCILYFLSQCGDGAQLFAPVRGGVIEHVDFALQPGAALAGTIYDRASGLPRYGGRVEVYDSQFNVVWDGGTDESGAFQSGAWYPGTYYVKAKGFAGPAGCAFYDGRPCPISGQDPASVLPTPITLGAGEIRTGVDFRLDGETVFRSGFEP